MFCPRDSVAPLPVPLPTRVKPSVNSVILGSGSPFFGNASGGTSRTLRGILRILCAGHALETQLAVPVHVSLATIRLGMPQWPSQNAPRTRAVAQRWQGVSRGE